MNEIIPHEMRGRRRERKKGREGRKRERKKERVRMGERKIDGTNSKVY